MFNPKLRELGEDKLIYSTSLGFRIIFILMAGFIFISVIAAGTGPLLTRFNGISVFIILISVFAALYLERWSFDKKSNSFEKNVGLLFFHSRSAVPLDTLEKVVIYEPGPKQSEQPKYSRMITRRSALVSIVDKSGNLYKLDLMKGGSVSEGRRIAESLSIFCEIPLVDETGGPSGDRLS